MEIHKNKFSASCEKTSNEFWTETISVISYCNIVENNWWHKDVFEWWYTFSALLIWKSLYCKDVSLLQNALFSIVKFVLNCELHLLKVILNMNLKLSFIKHLNKGKAHNCPTSLYINVNTWIISSLLSVIVVVSDMISDKDTNPGQCVNKSSCTKAFYYCISKRNHVNGWHLMFCFGFVGSSVSVKLVYSIHILQGCFPDSGAIILMA